MFQIFRRWIFANRQINDVSIWVLGGNIRNITYDFWILQQRLVFYREFILIQFGLH